MKINLDRFKFKGEIPIQNTDNQLNNNNILQTYYKLFPQYFETKSSLVAKFAVAVPIC